MATYNKQYSIVRLPIASGGDSVKSAVYKLDDENANIYSLLSSLNTGKVPYRQTVLTGSIGADGLPNYLSASGLTVSILASTPLLLAFAQGFGNDGFPIDFLSIVTSNVANAWNLPPSQTCYLYIDRDSTTGALTYGYTIAQPSYAKNKPINPATGQFWYSPIVQKAQIWNGANWDIRQRIYVAKAVTTASEVVLTYGELTTDEIISQIRNDLYAALTPNESFIMINPVNGYISPPLPAARDFIGQNFCFLPQGIVTAATGVYFYVGDGTVTLNSALNNSATTITLSKAITFTGTPYAIIDLNGTPEVVQMTAGSGSVTISIVRGQLGTTAVAHNAGGVVLPNNFGDVSISNNAPIQVKVSMNPKKRDLIAYSVSGTGLSGCTLVCTREWGNA